MQRRTTDYGCRFAMYPMLALHWANSSLSRLAGVARGDVLSHSDMLNLGSLVHRSEIDSAYAYGRLLLALLPFFASHNCSPPCHKPYTIRKAAAQNRHSVSPPSTGTVATPSPSAGWPRRRMITGGQDYVPLAINVDARSKEFVLRGGVSFRAQPNWIEKGRVAPSTSDDRAVAGCRYLHICASRDRAMTSGKRDSYFCGAVQRTGPICN